MSGVAVIRTLLAAYAPLTAVVPAAKIAAGDIPLNTVLPAITVSRISRERRNTVAMNEVKTLVTERVQATVNAKTYQSQDSILALIMRACPHQRGTIGGIDVDSILPDTAGPDFADDAGGIFTGSQDFIVRWRATN